MTNRPTFIDLRSQSHGPLGNSLSSPRNLPSPRLHVAGDIPPALSPLDAFAAQSRALAKQLEESVHSGRRMSRLPPLAIENTFIQGRPSYFRSLSAEATPTSPQKESPSLAIQPEVEAPLNRPVSVHPSLGGGPLPNNSAPPLPAMPWSNFRTIQEEHRGRKPDSRSPPEDPGYFGIRRELSPPPVDREPRLPYVDATPSVIQPRSNVDSVRARAQNYRKVNDNSLGISNYDSRALAPPRSPYRQPRTPSPRSMSNTSSDDDAHGTNQGTGVQVLSPHWESHRKLSSSSGISTSPTSPNIGQVQQHMPRSPSISSEISVGGTRLPRPAFNFSRPMSRASAMSIPVDLTVKPDTPTQQAVDTPTRQASSDSQPSFLLADDTVHTPVSMHSEGFPENETGGAPSYVYSRFSLPRGKMLQRNSLIFQENLETTQISWEQPLTFSNVQPYNGAPPSPPSRPSTSHQVRPSVDRARPSYDPSLDAGRPSYDPRSASSDFIRPSTDYGTPSLSSGSTIKARSQHSLTATIDMSAEEHVAKAIQFHEEGALTKSTYHLRLAARQNHPTGMLLYALACRHGWGCRPNQKEGVAWLRKAADSASLEIADDEDLIKDGKSVDILERKTRKAQFALSIYELGVSHMNGWGIEQDKVLALRCFEIAGCKYSSFLPSGQEPNESIAWGDADALAETGFCYAQGIGCKKNLKKSAKFYRQAEAKGISMVGNSWYVLPLQTLRPLLTSHVGSIRINIRTMK
jgi:TPR repeat protein